jgi:hypothetical protein
MKTVLLVWLVTQTVLAVVLSVWIILCAVKNERD